jgi:3',5'-cyclic-AMP phosphodiesterase
MLLGESGPRAAAGGKVRRIAHLSDAHILEAHPSSGSHNLSVKFVSLGRTLDGTGRARKLKQALVKAERGGADHFVISGDLTEVGSEAQYEAFAIVLHDSGIHPERVTLVPGNHDAYTSRDAWKRALEGPLRAYATGAADAPGRVVDRGDVVFLPVDVSCHQSIARSAAELTAENADVLERRFMDPGFRDKAVVVVQHHQPFGHARSAWQWWDGLRGHARLMDLLGRYRPVSLLHGHMHKVLDRLVGLTKSRVFCAPAIVEDEDDVPRVRLYDVRDGALEAAGMAA